jgi:hypothetical protein
MLRLDIDEMDVDRSSGAGGSIFEDGERTARRGRVCLADATGRNFERWA